MQLRLIGMEGNRPMALARTFLRTIAPRRIVIATLLIICRRRCRARRRAARRAGCCEHAAQRLLRRLARALQGHQRRPSSPTGRQKTGETVPINQSHGGSSKQARAVVDGLEADVVTMNQAHRHRRARQARRPVAGRLAKQVPNNAAPYTSTTVFLVRKGNPKGIKDWDDLAKAGVEVIIPNPEDLRQRPLHLPRRLGLCAGRWRQRRRRRARNSSARCSPTCRCSTAADAAPRPRSRSATSATCSSPSRTKSR